MYATENESYEIYNFTYLSCSVTIMKAKAYGKSIDMDLIRIPDFRVILIATHI
jgi:hypothetical protein